METAGQPGRAAGIEIPADGVRAVFLQGIEGIDGIALGFAHLLAVLILHQSEHNHVFKGRLVEQQGGFRQQGVEPASGLVHRLGNELSRELLFKGFLIFKRIMMLGERHCAGIEPAVNHLRHPLHRLAALRAGDGDGVDIRTVQLHGLCLRIAA